MRIFSRVHYITDADLGYVCEIITFHLWLFIRMSFNDKSSRIFLFFFQKYDYKASLVFVFNDVVKNILKNDTGIKQVITAAPPRLNDMNKIFSKNYEKKNSFF